MPIDYISDKTLRMANPSCGVTVTIEELRAEAEMALNDPQTRMEFFNTNVECGLLIRWTLTLMWMSSSQVTKQFNWTIEGVS